jgi:hypothetical protein
MSNSNELSGVSAHFDLTCFAKSTVTIYPVNNQREFLPDERILLAINGTSVRSKSHPKPLKPSGTFEKSAQAATKKPIDVFGKETDPICDYLRCRHNFSLHAILVGQRSICKCKHPQNKTMGLKVTNGNPSKNNSLYD